MKVINTCDDVVLLIAWCHGCHALLAVFCRTLAVFFHHVKLVFYMLIKKGLIGGCAWRQIKNSQKFWEQNSVTGPLTYLFLNFRTQLLKYCFPFCSAQFIYLMPIHNKNHLRVLYKNKELVCKLPMEANRLQYVKASLCHKLPFWSTLVTVERHDSLLTGINFQQNQNNAHEDQPSATTGWG